MKWAPSLSLERAQNGVGFRTTDSSADCDAIVFETSSLRNVLKLRRTANFLCMGKQKPGKCEHLNIYPTCASLKVPTSFILGCLAFTTDLQGHVS